MKNTNESDLPIRQLIKFSNYSLCITLPKDFIDNLGWQQGDRISFQLTQENSLTLAKQVISIAPNLASNTTEIESSTEVVAQQQTTPEMPEESTETQATPTNESITLDNLDNLEPIPQLS